MTEQPKLNRDFLETIVRCPVTRQKLKFADAALLAQVNRAIAEGRVTNVAGEPLSDPLAAALVREDRQVLYPVEEGLPKLLGDEGVPLPGLNGDGL